MGLPPAVLQLGPDTIVILLRNIAYDAGLYNGIKAMAIVVTPGVLDIPILAGRGRE